MTAPTKPNSGLLLQLALRDLLYDRKVSFCIIASLIAVITPLLLLFSLKYGVVSQLRSQLINDPQNLEVLTVGNLQLDQRWFDELGRDPHVGFIIPLTRSLNTQADLMKDRQHFVSGVEILPTASGDPLMQMGAQNLSLHQSNGVILSALAAEKLAAKIGDSIRLVVNRQLDGVPERGLVELSVEGVLPESAFVRAGAFVPLDLLLQMEDFRDGYRVEIFNNILSGEAKSLARQNYARARLYAKDLDSVAPLALSLRQKNIETRTQAKAIENVKSIDYILSIIFSIIAGAAIIGCVLSLIGAFLANIDRKRKDIALLLLFGFKPNAVVLYLMMQAIFLSALAFVASYGLYLSGSLLFNSILGSHLPTGIFVSVLLPSHIVIAFVISLVLAAIVAASGARQAITIQPAESLRDV